MGDKLQQSRGVTEREGTISMYGGDSGVEWRSGDVESNSQHRQALSHQVTK